MSVPKQIEEVIKEKLKNNADIKEINELMDLYERAKSLFVEEYKMINVQPNDDKQPFKYDPYKTNYITCDCPGISKELYNPYGWFDLSCGVSDKKNYLKNVEDIVKAVSKDLNKINRIGIK